MSLEGDDLDRERRLRSFRLERRQQQEEFEAIVRESDAARLTLADVLRDAGERGDRCLLEAGPHRLTGFVVHVGEEVVRLVDGPTDVAWDVALRHLAVVSAVDPGRHAHRVGRGHPRTVLARGRELAARGATVDVGLSHRADALRGQVRDVSAEVLQLDRGTAGPVTLSWPAVVWLSEPVDPLRRRSPDPGRSRSHPA